MRRKWPRFDGLGSWLNYFFSEKSEHRFFENTYHRICFVHLIYSIDVEQIFAKTQINFIVPSNCLYATRLIWATSFQIWSIFLQFMEFAIMLN